MLNSAPRHKYVCVCVCVCVCGVGECIYSFTRSKNLALREWVVSFTPWPIYTWGDSPRFSLDRGLLARL